MAAKLQVRLTFEGGQEMKKALAELGVQGKATFGGLGSAADAVGSALGALGDVVKTVATSIAAVGGVVGATAAGIFALAKSSAEAADSAGKAAQKIGVNAKAYQELAFAAKLADVEQDALQAGLKALNKNIVEAAGGNQDLAAAFASVGVKLKTSGVLTNLQKFQLAVGDIKSVPKTLITAEQAILGLADAFKGAPDGPRKTALAMQLLGKTGSDLIPLLNSGSKEIVGLGNEAERLGLVFDDKAIKASEEFNDTLTTLEGAITGVKNSIGQVFLPELTTLAASLTEFIVSNRAAIVDWVQKGWNFLKQVVLDVIAIFQGRDADVVNTWLLTARDNLNKALDVATQVGNAILRILNFFGLLEDAKAKAAQQADLSNAVAGSRAPFGNATAVQRFNRGGMLDGRPGTDTNLAWFNKGEYFINKDRVQQFGRGFFDAINFGGQIPAFDSGGMMGGGRPVNLNLDGRRFALSGGNSAIADLTRTARQRSLLAPGRKPSWMTRR